MLLTINDCGPTLSEKDLCLLEESLNVELPNDYRNFLLRHNGGLPVENSVRIFENKLGINSAAIGYFYSVGTKTENIEVCLNIISDRIPEKLIPIADTPNGNYFLISANPHNYGKIYYKDHETEDITQPDWAKNILPESMIKIADSFSEFVDNLYDPNEQ